MTDRTELKRLAVAIESCASIPVKDEAAWMRRTTGRAVIEALEELDELRNDAERYRWLMSNAVMNGTLGILGGWIDFEFKDEAQEQIDAAMSNGEQP